MSSKYVLNAKSALKCYYKLPHKCHVHFLYIYGLLILKPKIIFGHAADIGSK